MEVEDLDEVGGRELAAAVLLDLAQAHVFDFLEEVEGGVEDHEEAVGGEGLAAFGARPQQLDEPAHVLLDGFGAEGHLFAVFEVGFAEVEYLC